MKRSDDFKLVDRPLNMHGKKDLVAWLKMLLMVFLVGIFLHFYRGGGGGKKKTFDRQIGCDVLPIFGFFSGLFYSCSGALILLVLRVIEMNRKRGYEDYMYGDKITKNVKGMLIVRRKNGATKNRTGKFVVVVVVVWWW